MKLALALVLAFGCHSSQDHARNTCEVALHKNAACYGSSPELIKKRMDELPEHLALCTKAPKEVAMFDKCLALMDCYEFTTCQTANAPGVDP